MENHDAERHTKIKVKNPRDLFSIIPYALGYQPEESLLVICIRQTGGLGMMARTSLTDLTNNDCCLELSQLVARNAADDETARAFVVVYCRATDEFTLHSYKKQARYFKEALKSIPTETWVINAQKYYQVDCQGVNCCPPEGFPISDLIDTEATAALVYRGYAPARNREDYLRLPEPSKNNIEVAHNAETQFASEKRKHMPNETWRQKAFSAWQSALELAAKGAPISPKIIGLLGAALTDTTMRDAVLLSCLPGGTITAEKVIRNSGMAERTNTVNSSASDLLARVVDGGDADMEPILPGPHLVMCATTVLEAVASHASRANKPGPLTLLAFLAWWSGDGTRANARLRQALNIIPSYPLAVTLAAAVENHLLPAWIHARYRSTGSGAVSSGPVSSSTVSSSTVSSSAVSSGTVAEARADGEAA